MESLANDICFQPAQKTRTGMSFIPLCDANGKPISFLLGEPGTFPSHVPFEPGVFGGSGQEQRKAIRFSLDQDVLDVIKDFERRLQEQLPSKNIGWNSCVVDATDLYRGTLKAKIWVAGDKACIVRDESGEAIALPGQPWPRPFANARILVKGVYRQSSSNLGLILHVTHLHLSERRAAPEPDPFI